MAKLDRQFWGQSKVVVGVDEVGKGCLAGPVYAGAVALDAQAFLRLKTPVRGLIRDSKTLSAAQREKARVLILKVSLACAVGVASVAEIEQQGIQGATESAMMRAIAALNVSIDMLLVDGKIRLKPYQGAQMTVVDGDFLSPSIAAASILAKLERDAFMHQQALVYQKYGFNRHVGYGTAYHIKQIEEHGICPLHRRNFQPIKAKLMGALSTVEA